MGLEQKLFARKQEFHDIFNKMPKNNLDFMTDGGYYSLDYCIEQHLKAWIASRIYGGSASMVFYEHDISAIKLIDKIAREHFINQ